MIHSKTLPAAAASRPQQTAQSSYRRLFGFVVASTATLAAILFSGCALVQSSSHIKLPGAELYLPKDFHADTLAISRHTNGTFSVNMENVTARMNPEILDKATKRDVALITATTEAVAKVVAAVPK